MNITHSEIDRLIRSWAKTDGLGMSEEEYQALLNLVPSFKHRQLAAVLGSNKPDRLREDVRSEIIARGQIRSPCEKRLVILAILLGVFSSVVTIVSYFRDRPEPSPRPVAVENATRQKP